MAENLLLRARLGKRRLLFTDAERRTLATLAKAIGSRVLADLNPIVSPATLKIDIEQLIVRMASDNPG